MDFSFKTILAVTLFTAMTCSVFSAPAKCFIVKKGGKKEYYDKIIGDGIGVLQLKKGKVTHKIKPGAYIYAYTSMPLDIKKATAAFKAKKYSESAAMLEKCYPKYKFVGWDVYCLYLGAKALYAGGNKNGAISTLSKITKKPVNPSSLRYYMPSQKLLATLYVETDNSSKAEKILKILLASNDNAIVAFGYNQYGDLLLKKGGSSNVKDAKLMYLSTALLFDAKNKKERPEALLKIIKLLKSEKNNKALEFEKKLRADYPGSLYLKDL